MLGEDIVRRFQAQVLPQLVFDKAVHIILPGPDIQRTEFLYLRAEQVITYGGGTIAAAEFDVQALLGVVQALVAAERDAAVGGKGP